MELDVNSHIDVRPIRQDEVNFVLNSWMRSLRKGSTYYAAIPAKIYYAMHAESIRQLLREASCLVATPNHDPSIILAYVVFDPRNPSYVIIHYAYTKSKFRGMGIARHLVESIRGGRDLVSSHFTSARYLKKVPFNPYFFTQARF